VSPEEGVPCVRTSVPRRSPVVGLSIFCFFAGLVVPQDNGSTERVEADITASTDQRQAPTPPAGAVAAPTATRKPTAVVTPADIDIDLTSFDATPPVASWTKPLIGVTYADPVYRTQLRRVTSADDTRFNRNTYSRRQAENADGTLFMTYHGDAEYRVHDRVTLALVRTLDIHPDAEPQWHPTDADLVRSVAGGNASSGALDWFETSVSTGRTSIIADLTIRITARFPSASYMKDQAEGSPSADGNRMAWTVFDGAENPIGIVSYDLATDQILGTFDLSDAPADAGPLDWVSMSPTGRYVMAGHWNATLVFNADLTNPRRVNNKGDHSDIALSAAGTDSYVYIDFSADRDAGWLVAVDLTTLERTRLVDLYNDANTSIHVSGKGYDQPGWVVVSTYNCKDAGAWSCEKIMLVDISGTGRVYDLAHTYNCGDDYWTETHAVVNRSFTRVYFNSDGGSCGIDAEVYELTLPHLGPSTRLLPSESVSSNDD